MRHQHGQKVANDSHGLLGLPLLKQGTVAAWQEQKTTARAAAGRCWGQAGLLQHEPGWRETIPAEPPAAFCFDLGRVSQ